jgi:ribonucleoside-diphosphate reductase alpha chain
MGVGVSGLSDTFIMMRYPFDSHEARELNKKIFETIYYAAIDESCTLAEKLGTYETYQGSEFSKGKFQWDLWEEENGTKLVHSGLWDWDKLKERVAKHGMRNSLLTAPMPTASTSQILGNSECIEPINSNIYKRQTLSGEFIMVNRFLIKDLCDLNIWNDSMKQKIIENRGSITSIKEIPEYLQKLYKTSWEMSPKVIIDMSADRSPYIDQSQSLNLFVASPEIEKLARMHFYAYEKKLKTGLYYLKMKSAVSPLQISVNKKQNVNVVEEESVESCKRTDPNCISCSS